MKEKQQKLWIIPGEGLEDHGLENGKAIFYGLDLGSNLDHRDRCSDFCKRYNFDVDSLNSHEDYGKFFASLGMVTFFNSGVKVDGKYYGLLIFPEVMSDAQIAFFEERYDFFKENYNQHRSWFVAKVFSMKPVGYRNDSPNLRNLYTESIIDGKKTDNGLELIYREINRQKEMIRGKHHEDTI